LLEIVQREQIGLHQQQDGLLYPSLEVPRTILSAVALILQKHLAAFRFFTTKKQNIHALHFKKLFQIDIVTPENQTKNDLTEKHK